MRALSVTLLAVLLTFAAPALAPAQLGPQVPDKLTAPPPPPPEPAQVKEDRGLTTLAKVGIFGGAALILGLTGWFIVRDAHRAAPVEEQGPQTPEAKKARDRKREHDQRRARAKAARRQRKKNRR